LETGRDSMDAPKCIVCNTRHWSTQPCPAMATVIAEEQNQQRRKIAESVNQPVSVTKNEAVTVNPLTINTPVNPVTENVTINKH
jgi:hypothetical protein